MSKFLKGNYPLAGSPGQEGGGEEVSLEKEFEKKALEKLGGSIAFVRKGKDFLWTGPEPKSD